MGFNLQRSEEIQEEEQNNKKVYQTNRGKGKRKPQFIKKYRNKGPRQMCSTKCSFFITLKGEVLQFLSNKKMLKKMNKSDAHYFFTPYTILFPCLFFFLKFAYLN